MWVSFWFLFISVQYNNILSRDIYCSLLVHPFRKIVFFVLNHRLLFFYWEVLVGRSSLHLSSFLSSSIFDICEMILSLSKSHKVCFLGPVFRSGFDLEIFTKKSSWAICELYFYMNTYKKISRMNKKFSLYYPDIWKWFFYQECIWSAFITRIWRNIWFTCYLWLKLYLPEDTPSVLTSSYFIARLLF